MIRTTKRALSRNHRVGVWVVTAGLLLAACTTVPRSSAPQVIKSFGVAQQPVVPAPPAGADARAIVQGFLEVFTKELPMEYAIEFNRLVKLEMEGSLG